MAVSESDMWHVQHLTMNFNIKANTWGQYKKLTGKREDDFREGPVAWKGYYESVELITNTWCRHHNIWEYIELGAVAGDDLAWWE